MKLSELKGQKAIEVFADLLEPVATILGDEEINTMIKNDTPKIVVIKTLLKKHSDKAIEILAILDDTPVDKYEVNFITLPVKLLELMNDPMVIELFTSQGQNTE